MRLPTPPANSTRLTLPCLTDTWAASLQKFLNRLMLTEFFCESLFTQKPQNEAYSFLKGADSHLPDLPWHGRHAGANASAGLHAALVAISLHKNST